MEPVYVVSDIHGYRGDLVDGLYRAGIVDDAERWCGGDKQLWILGDLLDRGPDGIGVIDLVMSLERQAPEHVHTLMGNHEILAVARHRFPRTEFVASWKYNGGRRRDQKALTPAHLEWLCNLPVVARVGAYLLVHSDTAAYLGWGTTVEEVNSTVRAMATGDDFDKHWQLWSRLTSRSHFWRKGSAAAREVLDTLGGECIVHGHNMIGMLLDIPSVQVDGPVRYADGLALAIDGGRYDGGPLLVVELD